MPRIKRLTVASAVVLLTLGSTDVVHPPTVLTIRMVWMEPLTPPRFDCDDQAYALNNPDKCGLPGPFLLGGGAPKGGGLLGAIGGVLGGLTGGLL